MPNKVKPKPTMLANFNGSAENPVIRLNACATSFRRV